MREAQTIQKSEIDQFISIEEQPKVSICLPISIPGVHPQKNRIRIKNQLQKINSILEKKFSDASDDICSHIEKWEDAVGSLDGREQLGFLGLATKNKSYAFSLPFVPPEVSQVGPTFYVLPLISLWTQVHESKYYVLALDQNQTELFRANQFSLRKVTLPSSFPRSLKDAMGYELTESQLQFHTASTGRSEHLQYHGQGAGKDIEDKELDLFIHEVAKHIYSYVGGKHPLILASTPELVGKFRKTSSSLNLADTYVHGNPHQHSENQLHQQSWKIARDLISKTKTIEVTNEMLDDVRTINELVQDIVNPSKSMERIVIHTDRSLWGKFDMNQYPRPFQLDHQKKNHAQEELLNILGLQAWQYGREVVQV